MDWNDVRYFLALARTGSVRAAGTLLGVSHSTVARRVEALEARLGVKLFDRNRDGYLLTSAGNEMMIRIADQKKAAKGATNVTFHQGTLDEGSPFEPAQFTGVWAYSILHLVNDRKRTLKTIFELLEPGGSFISSNVCLGETWIPYGALIAVMRWFGKAPVVHRYDRDTIMRELRETGFVDVEEKDVGAQRVVAFIVARKPR
jgi:molybdenum-dependent DNA-binding transcriptional regulator ModE